MALSVEPCLETHKTAKPAIHGRSVYNLHRPLTAKQPAQIHPGLLRGGEEQSNYILKQQSKASSACKQTSSTHTNTHRFRHKQYVCQILGGLLFSFGLEYVRSVLLLCIIWVQNTVCNFTSPDLNVAWDCFFFFDERDLKRILISNTSLTDGRLPLNESIIYPKLIQFCCHIEFFSNQSW